MTTPPPWSEVERVLLDVLELPAGAREDYLSSTCSGDPALRQEVERLLAACVAADRDGEFLASPAMEMLAPVLGDVEAAERDDSLAGDQIERLRTALQDRYQVDREVGHGGMATVYLARDLKHERRVALKVMRPSLRRELGAQRFLLEIRTLAALNHPHILPLHDSGEIDGLLFYVTPFFEGESLRGRMKREGPLPASDVTRVLRDVAGALSYAHRQGVVHRDIKPENILLQAGHAVLADFGIARAVDRAIAGAESADGLLDDTMTPTGLVVGTPAYMPPEQLRGVASVDHRADLFALGVTAFEMLTGARPSRASASPGEPGADAGIFSTLRQRRPDLPEPLCHLIARLVATNADERYASADDMLADIDKLSSGDEGSRSREGTGKLDRVAEFARRRPAYLGVAVGLIALAGVAIASAIPARREAVPLDASKVAVHAFTSNATNDTAAERVAQLASEWIVQGLSQTKLVTVVPMGLLAPRGSDQSSAGSLASLVVAAREAGAGLMITGTYQRVADTMMLNAQVIDARTGTVLRPIGPIRFRRDAALSGVDTLRQRVMASLATVVDPRMTHWASAASQPRTFEAYQVFVEGLAAFFNANSGQNPLPLFRRAHALDTSFTAPLLWALFRSNPASTDSIISYLQERRSRLPPWDQGVLDFFRRKHPDDGYLAFRRVVEAAPQSEWLYMLAWTALDSKRPAVAVRALERLDPDRGWMRYWPSYWNVLAAAHHALGDYDDALRAARRGRKKFPAWPGLLIHEIAALAALGRDDELRRIVGELSYHNVRFPQLSFGFDRAISELRRHGHVRLADSLTARLLRELDERRGVSPVSAPRIRFDLLWAAMRWDEAAPILDTLLERRPQDDILLGHRAMLLARRGQRLAAESILVRVREELASRRGMGAGPASFRFTRLLAATYALSGDHSRALEILNPIRGIGSIHTDPFHLDAAYEPLWNNRAFNEFARAVKDDPDVLPRR